MEENKVEETKEVGGKSIASFVLGLIGIIAWLLPLFGYPVTIVGLSLGCIARKKEKNGFSLAGIILSTITLILTLINSIMGVIMVYSLNRALY